MFVEVKALLSLCLIVNMYSTKNKSSMSIIIVGLSDSTLDMSVIFSGSPFVFGTPWKYFCLQRSTSILLIVALPGSIRLDSYFNFC